MGHAEFLRGVHQQARETAEDREVIQMEVLGTVDLEQRAAGRAAQDDPLDLHVADAVRAQNGVAEAGGDDQFQLARVRLPAIRPLPQAGEFVVCEANMNAPSDS